MTATETRIMREEHLDLTQEEFAELLGVSQPAVSRWENGSLPVDGASERILTLLKEAPKRRVKSKKEWIGWIAAGTAALALVFLMTGKKK